jgi:hypothetical protein
MERFDFLWFQYLRRQTPSIVWASSQDSGDVFVFTGPYLSPVTKRAGPERREVRFGACRHAVREQH